MENKDEFFEALNLLKMMKDASEIASGNQEKKKPKRDNELKAHAIGVAQTIKELYSAFRNAGFSEDFTEKLIIAIVTKEN